ncbi:LacI family DNA-binding transcriptional regulator [Cellulomonas edaphi]|uniref:LacI family DNA-binding transcriptional regulator n=1 Tax=Cellulomonas edaphi TaxID=3053468 RepID=A0ABT7SAZ2_9CELL|nr:LacI family DNA-binding transcriptional regulator [Cellulomons edaphi]MDM7832192.1 LacI family DNA-binding transcriptional regulator [Cellulomons edaphi]
MLPPWTRRYELSTQRPTLADVAAAAGVSVSTASLAFSGAGPIAAATRERVHEAAAQLGYAGPNPLGRQLRRGRSGIVGVVIGDALRRAFRDPVSTQVLDGLVGTLGPLDLGVLLIPSLSDPDSPGVDPLLESAAMDVAVVMWGGGDDDPLLETLRRRGIPTVLVEGQLLPGIGAVGIDDRSGIEQVTRHLVELGHTRIACVTLPLNRDRGEGFIGEPELAGRVWAITRRRLDGMADAGVTPVAVWQTPASLVEHGATAGRALLSGPDRPTAVVCQSDLLASGVVLAARELGLRVPQDVSVAGFDGIELPWLGTDVLTTVVQPLTEKGAAVGHLVRDLLAGAEPDHRELPVTLRVGTTTGPAPS